MPKYFTSIQIPNNYNPFPGFSQEIRKESSVFDENRSNKTFLHLFSTANQMTIQHFLSMLD